jgi:hypothetical protein
MKKMKKYLRTLTVLFLSIIFVFAACNKDKNAEKDELYNEIEYQQEDLKFDGDGDYDKVIVNPIVKLEGCKFIVAGTIEFRKDGEVIATVDFGDGTCDNLATKTVNGETTEFKLDFKEKDDKYKKVVVEPIIKLENCEYIVAGIVKFYEGDLWVATLDFGDGTCDEWATKTWDGGSKVFSMKKD